MDVHIARRAAADAIARRRRAGSLPRSGAQRPRRALVVIGALLATAGLAACGDDGPPQTTATAVTGATTTVSPDPGAASADPASGKAEADGSGAEAPTDATGEPARPRTDEQLIRSTLNGVLVVGDAQRTCNVLVTDNYLTRSYGDLKGCLAAQAPKAMATSIVIKGVDIDASEGVAMASVVTKGGIYGGEPLRAELVKKTDGWRLDHLRSNVPVGP